MTAVFFILAPLFVYYLFSSKNNLNRYYFFCIALCSVFTFVSFYIGGRDAHVGTDTQRYINMYEYISSVSVIELVKNERIEILYLLTNKLFAFFGLGYEHLFTFVVLFFVYSIYLLAKLIFRDFRVGFLVVFLYLCWPFFFSLSINVLRQCLSISFVFLAIYSFLKERKRSYFLFSIVASLFHFSGYMAFLIPLVSFRKITVEKLLLFWILIFAFSLLGFFNYILSFIDLDRLAVYFDGGVEYKVGFRWDFLLLSCVPVIFYFLCFDYYSENYRIYFMLKLFIVFNYVYIIFINIPFSDRFAIMSWIYIPFFIIPIFVKKTYLMIFFIPIFSIFSFYYMTSVGVL